MATPRVASVGTSFEPGAAAGRVGGATFCAGAASAGAAGLDVGGATLGNGCGVCSNRPTATTSSIIVIISDQSQMEILRFCEAHLDRTVQTIETLVRLESPSTDKSAVDRCGAALEGMLREAGAAVERLPQTDRGDHLIARFEGAGDPVLILGHFDTVWPAGTLDRMP